MTYAPFLRALDPNRYSNTPTTTTNDDENGNNREKKDGTGAVTDVVDDVVVEQLEYTARQLTEEGIRVRDYAYPSKCVPAPYANMPAPPLAPGQHEPTVYFDPQVAYADHEFRVFRDTKLPIDGQKTRWLLDMGWLTEHHKSKWRDKDREALREYDAFVSYKRERGLPTVSYVIPRKYRHWKGPGLPPPDPENQGEAGEKHKSCVIA